MLTKEQFADLEKRVGALTAQDAERLFYEVKDLRRLVGEVYDLSHQWSAARTRILEARRGAP